MDQPRAPLRRFGLEALAIFLGVSAGLVGDDWRESRIDRGREREALVQMLQDLEIDAADIAPIVEHSRVRMDAMLRVHNLVADGTADAAALSEPLNDAFGTEIYSYEASNFTYSGLKASGRLDLIRDTDLRRDLVFYFEDRQAAMEVTNSGWLETDIRFFHRLAPYVRYRSTEELVPPPPLRIVDVAGLMADGELLFLALELGMWSRTQHDLTGQMLDLNASLAGAVGEYLRTVGGAP